MERNYSPNSHQKIWKNNGLRTSVLLGVISDIHRVLWVIADHVDVKNDSHLKKKWFEDGCLAGVHFRFQPFGCQKWIPERHLLSSQVKLVFLWIWALIFVFFWENLICKFINSMHQKLHDGNLLCDSSPPTMTAMSQTRIAGQASSPTRGAKTEGN